MNDSRHSRPKMPSVRRSLVFAFARQYTNLLIGLPTIIVVSRLLTPTQIGIYSVSVATTAVVQMLRDFGVSEYLVQAKNLDDEMARSAFTVNLIIAWTLAVVVFISSPWIAVFYKEPGVGFVLQVLSLNFVLLPFGSTVTAMLNRSMQFGILYKINLGAVVVRSGTTIALAALGFGYMSPAWASVAGMIASVAGCTWWGRAYRIRGLALTHWRAVGGFGIKQTAGDIMTQLGFYAPDFVIGRVLGFADVGMYSRGYGLINMFNTKIMAAIGDVSFPAFAHSQRDTEGAERLYLKTLTFISGIALPFAVFAALMALPIIHLMFGHQWDRAVPILRLLAIAMFVNMLSPQFAQFFTGTGRVGITTTATTAIQVFRIAILIPAAFYGLEAAAASQIVAAVFSVSLKNWLLYRYTGITRRAVLSALRPSFALCFTAAIVPALVYALMPVSNDFDMWVSITLAISGGGGGWILGAWMLKHPLWFELVNAQNRFYRRKTSPG